MMGELLIGGVALSLLFAASVDSGRVFASGRSRTQLLLCQLVKVLRRLLVSVAAVLPVAMVRCYCW